MTSLAALVLVSVALCALLYPLLIRPRPGRSVSGEVDAAELQEQYRGALADLQDAQTDWEVGNISQDEYERLREGYRRRAAQLLRQIHTEGLGVGGWGLASLPIGEDKPRIPDPPPSTFQPPTSHPHPPALVVGSSLAVIALAGIAVLYLRAVHSQAAQAPVATLPLAHAHTVAIDENGTTWLGHHGGVFQSADGREWRNAGVAGDVMAVVRAGERRLVLGHDVLLVAADGDPPEAGWRPLSHDLPGTDVHGAQAVGGWLYAYVMGFGLFRSRDGGHWEQLSIPVPQAVGALAALPGQGGDLLFLAAEGTVIRSPDGGRTWSSAAGAVSLALSGFVRSIAVDPERGALFAATSEGVFRSTSAGADWVKLPFRGPAMAIGARGSRVAVVDDQGGVFVSADGGATWPASR